MKSNLIYESRPFLYIAGGLFAVGYSMSGFMTFAGWTLIVCAAIIVRARMRHRGLIK